MNALANFFATLDKRWIFLLVAIFVIVPLLNPVGLPVKVTSNTQMVYDLIESLVEGDTVLMSFDYDPPSSPELQPMANAVLRHLFKKNVKVIACAMWGPAPPLIDRAFNKTCKDVSTETIDGVAVNPAFAEKVYGKDFINLGAHAAYLAATSGMGTNFKRVWPTASVFRRLLVAGEKGSFDIDASNTLLLNDPLAKFKTGLKKVKTGYHLSFQLDKEKDLSLYRIEEVISDTQLRLRPLLASGEEDNTPATSLAQGNLPYKIYSEYHPAKSLDEYEITKNINTYKDLKLIFSLTTGTVGLTTYAQIANTDFGIPVTGGCTAVTALELYPYLQSGQMTGLLEGMKGAAEYELVSKYPGFRKATAGMESQSFVHLLIIFFILIANFVFYYEKKYGLKR